MESKKFKILAIDDEKLIRDMISEILNNYGYDVTSACNGPEALAFLKKTTFDLILSDISMPGKTGYEVFQEAKLMCPNVKFIFISAFDNQENIKKGISMGAKAFIGKPFDPDDLLDVIENTLKS